MESRIRNLSKQIDTEKRDRREDRRRRDVLDGADERDRRWDRRLSSQNKNLRIQRKESVQKNAGVTIQRIVTVVD